MRNSTVLVLHDSETDFQPRTEELDANAKNYITTAHATRDVSASVKLGATRVLVVTPGQMAMLCRLSKHKYPDRVLAATGMRVEGFVHALDVLKHDDVFEIGFRVRVDASLLKGAKDTDAIALSDASKIRILPLECVRLIGTAIADKKLDLSGFSGKKLLKEAVASMVLADGDDGPVPRIDFSTFEAVSGIKKVVSGARFAVGRAERKRKLETFEATKNELADLVTHTHLPAGSNQIAYSFPGAESISIAGGTVVVTYAEKAMGDGEAAAEAEE